MKSKRERRGRVYFTAQYSMERHYQKVVKGYLYGKPLAIFNRELVAVEWNPREDGSGVAFSMLFYNKKSLEFTGRQTTFFWEKDFNSSAYRKALALYKKYASFKEGRKEMFIY